MRLPRQRFTAGTLARLLGITAIVSGGLITALFTFVVAARQLLGRLMPMPNLPPLIFEMEALNLGLGVNLIVVGTILVRTFPRKRTVPDAPAEQCRRPARTFILATVVLVSVMLTLGIAWLDIRSESFRRKASEHYDAAVLISPKTNPDLWTYAKVMARFDYHSNLASKYGKLSSLPWLPVEPDPPIPE
jgi:hypothetical protein